MASVFLVIFVAAILFALVTVTVAAIQWWQNICPQCGRQRLRGISTNGNGKRSHFKHCPHCALRNRGMNN